MRTLADAFDSEIRRTWSTHAAQALVAALALGAVALLGWSVAWMLATGLVAVLALAVVAVAGRRRFLASIRDRALTPGAILAYGHERAILSLWMRSGECVELRTELLEIEGARRVRSPEERARLAELGRAAGLAADVEQELAKETLIGGLAREPFRAWVEAWRARSPFELDPGPIAELLHELSVQVVAAREYEKSAGQRAMVEGRDVREIPFVGKVAELQGRLQAALG